MSIPSHKLHYLYETYRRGSMRSASEHLGVAVSSISRQIAQIEQELGITLIEHGRRSVKLTEAGKLAIDYYRNTTAHQSQFVDQIRDLRSSRSGRIILAIGEGFVTPALAEMLALFHARFASLTVEVQVSGTVGVAERVADDEAHVGLVIDGRPHDKLSRRLVVPQPLYCVMSARHKLAMRSSLAFAEIAEHPLATLTDGFRLRQILTEAETIAGVTLPAVLVADSIALLKASLETGKFVSFLPTLPISAEIEAGRLIAVPTESVVLNAVSVSVVTRLGRQLPQAVLALLAMLEGGLRRWTALDAASHAAPIGGRSG